MQSRKDAAVIMIEVCRTISMLEYEWFQENEYALRMIIICRYRICCRNVVRIDQKLHTTELRLQLYKVQEHAYLLDFQKLQGNVCSFMHMCGTVIDLLQKGLSRNVQLMGKFYISNNNNNYYYYLHYGFNQSSSSDHA